MIKHWILVATCVFVLVTLGGVILVWGILPRVYSAMAQIQVQPEDLRIPSGNEDERPAPINFLPLAENIMQSPDVLTLVITELQLDQKWAQRFKLGADKMQQPDALKHLRGLLKVKLVRGTNIIDITASSDDPAEAADIANAVAISYKAKRDAQVAATAPSKEKVNIEAQMTLEENGIRQEIALRDSLISVFAKKGIPVPSDDEIIAEHAVPQSPKEDPQLIQYRRNEYQMAERQSILRTLQTQFALMGFANNQESPVRIVAEAATPTGPSRPSVGTGLPVIVLLGFLLGVGIATGVEIVFWIGRKTGSRTKLPNFPN